MNHHSTAFLTAVALSSAVPATARDFAGPHVDAVVGWSDGERGAGFPSARGDGVVIGGGGGYDLRSGNVVVGLTGEVSGVTGSTCRQLDFPGQGPNAPALSGRLCGKDGRTLFGGARAGYVVGGSTLLYVTGGYVNARTKDTFNGKVNATAAKLSQHADRDGLRIGAGMERQLGGHAYVKGEYRYTAVGDGLNQDQHQVVGGVGIRF